MNTFLIVWIAAFLIVSAWDFEEAQDEKGQYAQMVCDGAWPDYRDTNPECK